MHDTLRYIEHDPVHRAYHHDDITFGLLYAFSEKFILPISHDEVVYGKGSLLGKMPGDRWQSFANLRAYLGFMWAHPGKKLLFMGSEIAQAREWNHDAELDWPLLGDPAHAGIQRLVGDLNRLYAAEPSLHERDSLASGFRWLIGDDRANSVFAFLRCGEEDSAPVLVVCNMTPVPRHPIASACRAPAAGARSPTPIRASMAAATSATMARSMRSSSPRMASRIRCSSPCRRFRP